MAPKVCARDGDAFKKRFARPMDVTTAVEQLRSEGAPTAEAPIPTRAYPTCAAVQWVDTGDRCLYLGDVTDGASTALQASSAHIRKNELQYESLSPHRSRRAIG